MDGAHIFDREQKTPTARKGVAYELRRCRRKESRVNAFTVICCQAATFFCFLFFFAPFRFRMIQGVQIRHKTMSTPLTSWIHAVVPELPALFYEPYTETRLVFRLT